MKKKSIRAMKPDNRSDRELDIAADEIDRIYRRRGLTRLEVVKLKRFFSTQNPPRNLTKAQVLLLVAKEGIREWHRMQTVRPNGKFYDVNNVGRSLPAEFFAPGRWLPARQFELAMRKFNDDVIIALAEENKHGIGTLTCDITTYARFLCRGVEVQEQAFDRYLLELGEHVGTLGKPSGPNGKTRRN